MLSSQKIKSDNRLKTKTKKKAQEKIRLLKETWRACDLTISL